MEETKMITEIRLENGVEVGRIEYPKTQKNTRIGKLLNRGFFISRRFRGEAVQMAKDLNSGGRRMVQFTVTPDPKPATHFEDFGQNAPANAAPAVPFSTPEIAQPDPFDRIIQDGTYTVVFGDGHYRTLKFRTKTEGSLAGKTIVSYLSGPDNSTDFTGCAFYDQDRGTTTIWRRYRLKENASFCEEILEAVGVILGNPAKTGEAYALKSGRCCRCGKKLTVPASIHQGMGPDCFAKTGGL